MGTRTGKRVMAMALAGAALFAAGCGNKGGGPTADCTTLSDEAWVLFEQKSFAAALSKFHQAVGSNQGCPEAFHGLAWTELNAGQLDAATADFLQALADGATGPDPWAGLAIAALDLDQAEPDYTAAAEAADSALARSPDFVFEHDPTVDFRDMHLILAQCHYALQEYEAANAEVETLGGNVQDPGSPTFVADLLTEIERLQGDIAGQ